MKQQAASCDRRAATSQSWPPSTIPHSPICNTTRQKRLHAPNSTGSGMCHSCRSCQCGCHSWHPHASRWHRYARIVPSSRCFASFPLLSPPHLHVLLHPRCCDRSVQIYAALPQVVRNHKALRAGMPRHDGRTAYDKRRVHRTGGQESGQKRAGGRTPTACTAPSIATIPSDTQTN